LAHEELCVSGVWAYSVCQIARAKCRVSSTNSYY